MKNVMVCVTQQKTCDRLIKYGRQLLDEDTGNLFIIHVAPRDVKILGNSQEGEALDYLYGKAIEYGANLTVVKSNHILETLTKLVKENDIQQVVLGESGEVKNEENLIDQFREKISQMAELIVVSADQE